MRKQKEVTAKEAIENLKTVAEENKEAIREALLVKMVNAEREKVAGYEQIAKVHSAYIAILLKRLGATKDNTIAIEASEVREAMENYEARAIQTENGYGLYCEVATDEKQSG